jgi:hypothetical protein
MKHISMIIPNEQTSLVNIAGTHQIFSNVNEIADKFRKEPVFNVQLSGLSNEVLNETGLFTVNPECLMDDLNIRT